MGGARSFQARRRLKVAQSWNVSPRVFDGHVPSEVHEHFDADGQLTGRTVITRESEWDEATRTRVLELDAYEALLCPCGCGLSIMEAQKDQKFLVDVVTCYASRAVERFKQIESDKAKRENWPEHWEQGRHYFVRLVDEKDGA